MEKDNYIGTLLGNRYRIEQLIGVGGMAEVYMAQDTKEDKVVAVKILKDEFANNHEFVKKFVNESKVLAGLSHPSIVEIFDVNFDGNPKFMVMEYIDGITLKEYMETNNGPLSWKDTVHFTIQILRALQHAHARGVVHRDIKPHNIMLFTDGTVKVMDFGISKIAREEVKSSTEHTLGSVHYISPEQAQGQLTDEKSDIYSLGCVLYEMLTGKKPFDSDAGAVTVALMHSNDVAPSPRSINPNIPIGLEEIINKAMEKKPSKRYQSASEMIQALQMFKSNPDIVFNYGSEEETTKKEETVEKKVPVFAGGGGSANTVDVPNKSGKVTTDTGEEVEVERSYFLPILTGIVLVVVVVAVVFVASLIKSTFASDDYGKPEFTMPKIVGYDYNEVKTMYPELDISVSASQYSETYEKDTIMEQSVEVGTLCKNGVGVDVIISKGVKMVKVPDVMNFEYSVAEQTLKNEGLLVEKKFQYDDDVAQGVVIKSEPTAKEEIAPGSKVVLYISQGKYDVIVKVPDLKGQTLDAAKALIESKGLTWKVEYQNSNEAEGIVLDQNTQPNTEVESGTEVVIYVSNGIPPTSSVSVKFTLPSNASGTFTFQIYLDGSLSQERSGIVASATDGSVTIAIEGTGTQLVTVMLKNEANDKTSEYGRYNINFDDPSQEPEIISSKILQAFTDVDGIAVETQPVVSTYATDTVASIYDTPANTEPVTDPYYEPEVSDSSSDTEYQVTTVEDTNAYTDSETYGY